MIYFVIATILLLSLLTNFVIAIMSPKLVVLAIIFSVLEIGYCVYRYAKLSSN